MILKIYKLSAVFFAAFFYKTVEIISCVGSVKLFMDIVLTYSKAYASINNC